MELTPLTLFQYRHKVSQNQGWVPFVGETVPYWYTGELAKFFNCVL